MRVKVALLGTHARYLPRTASGSSVWLDMPGARARVVDVRAALGIPDGVPRLVYLRGEVVDDDTPLGDGDEVSFVAPLGGG